MTVPKLSPAAVAALVHARQNGGRVAIIGPHGKGAWQAFQKGAAEYFEGASFAELNLRGQDIADEAIALAAQPARSRR